MSDPCVFMVAGLQVLAGSISETLHPTVGSEDAINHGSYFRQTILKSAVTGPCMWSLATTLPRGDASPPAVPDISSLIPLVCSSQVHAQCINLCCKTLWFTTPLPSQTSTCADSICTTKVWRVHATHRGVHPGRLPTVAQPEGLR